MRFASLMRATASDYGMHYRKDIMTPRHYRQAVN